MQPLALSHIRFLSARNLAVRLLLAFVLVGITLPISVHHDVHAANGSFSLDLVSTHPIDDEQPPHDYHVATHCGANAHLFGVHFSAPSLSDHVKILRPAFNDSEPLAHLESPTARPPIS